ncbi:hypothetical protein [Novipirellula artificiosorum]|uniref:Uncharacterized protein n=1 Tax=Novipirellula artificiosorum TaxID=2528016 RepID=A0A5C6DKT9_9BACT|nr:hypothetical protein [Novipirellula artificiosorum]TWU37388.1 hypothetical protein Poly41_35180 [Novipirellula artificiosorum]
MPVSGLVITFKRKVADFGSSVEALRQIAEIELGATNTNQLAIVVDTDSCRRDQEIWDTIDQLPGVTDIRVALIGFDEETHSKD